MSQSPKPSFFDDIKEWSERKLRLLRKYLDGAARILGSTDEVIYLDGFAGRGSYGKPGEPHVPGSPLLAAQLAEEIAHAGRAYSLRCINIESDRATFEELESVTAPYPQHVTNIYGTFADSVDRVLTLIGAQPVIGFLDPFGVDGMDWLAVRKLIRRHGKTDLWLRFDVNEVRRRAGYFAKTDPGSDKQYEILLRVYGTSNKLALHDRLDSPVTPEARRLAAVDLYLARLQKEFTDHKREGYAAAYRIGSLTEEMKYYLIFATADTKGLVLASDIVYGIEEDYQRELERHRLAGQSTMFSFIDPSPEELFQNKVTAVAGAIWNQCAGKVLTRRELHAQLLGTGDWFGVIKGPHITSALKELVANGYITHHSANLSADTTRFTFRA